MPTVPGYRGPGADREPEIPDGWRPRPSSPPHRLQEWVLAPNGLMKPSGSTECSWRAPCPSSPRWTLPGADCTRPPQLRAGDRFQPAQTLKRSVPPAVPAIPLFFSRERTGREAGAVCTSTAYQCGRCLAPPAPGVLLHTAVPCSSSCLSQV